MGFRDDVSKQRQEVSAWFGSAKGLGITLGVLGLGVVAFVVSAIAGW